MDVDILHPVVQSSGIRHPVSSIQMKSRIEVLQGTLDFIVLQTLRWGPRHGYGIAQQIRANSNEALKVDTGSLYPALHRLERKKWISADWEISENRQRVRVYRLTAAGRKQLAVERTKWETLAAAIAGVMQPPTTEPEP